MGLRTAIDRLPAESSEPPVATQVRGRPLAGVPGRLVRAGAIVTLLAGLVTWALGAEVAATWCFAAAALAFALVLPFPLALVSPLFMAIPGWLVDMLPFVILVGWAGVVARWALGVMADRRLPAGGRWIWLPIVLAFWTILGALNISAADLKHFILLFAIQVLISGTLLAVVDVLTTTEAWIEVVSGLVAWVIVLSVVVFLQWVGVNIEGLQNSSARGQLESAYGLDSFPNSVGMVNYVRAENGGAGELRSALDRLSHSQPGFPEFKVFKPILHSYKDENLVRFEGSARPYEAELHRLHVTLLYDNVGVTPAATVPRMRSLPRNSLTYAGVCAVTFPLALFLAFEGSRRRRLLGRLGVASCLFGAAFSLSRGAWAGIAIGVVYLLLDGPVPGRLKRWAIAAAVAAAVVLTGVFMIHYGTDPLHARAGGEGSVGTRKAVYRGTLDSLRGTHYVVGYGTDQPRTTTGVSHVAGHYIPRAGTHSTYLNYLFRAGIPGALMIIAIYVIAFLHARAKAWLSTGVGRVLAATLAASVLVAGLHDVILSLYVEPAYTLPVSLILGLAMAGAASLPGGVWRWRHAGGHEAA